MRGPARSALLLSLATLSIAAPAFSAPPDRPIAHIMRVRSFASDVRVESSGSALVDGKFFLNTGDPSQFLTRLLPDGTVDLAFHNQIARTFPTTTVAPGVSALEIMPGGHLLVAATTTDPNGNIESSNVLRFGANGALDRAYGTRNLLGDGTMVFALRGFPDGSALAAGRFRTNNKNKSAYLIRLRPDGRIDNSFRSGQRPLETAGLAGYALLTLPDGGILVGKAPWRSERVAEANPEDRLTLLQKDGTEVTAFGRNASTATREGVFALARLPDGRIVAGGPATLVRLMPDGKVDTTFRPPKLVTTRPQEPFYVRTLRLQPDGKLLVGGDFLTPGGSRGLARLLPDGTIDQVFEKNMGAGFDAQGTDARGVSGVALMEDGRILAAGSFTSAAGRAARSVVRMKPDGTLEPFPAISEVGLPF